MRRLAILALLFAAVLTHSLVKAQHWTRLARFPSNGACGFFFNANEGLIGTGDYQHGSPIGIYLTNDGGQTWTQATLPAQLVYGEVTDIYFFDRLNGWATLKEANEHGWSGAYHSTDGGLTWTLTYQFAFPVGIRETKFGVFVSNRFEGVDYSTDGGHTFQLAGPSNGALGIDFMSDQVGYLSAESNAFSPHLRTIDGGTGWVVQTPPYEAWSVFADRASGTFFLASEKDPSTFSQSAILRSVDQGKSFASVWDSVALAITGGVAGSRGCESVVYVQGGPNSGGKGLMRSTNQGQNWKWIGGPSNIVDTRFAVTGRGAVVYASDASGFVWKTTDGGDGTLSPSILNEVKLKVITPSIVSAAVCDSAFAEILLQANVCDSASLAAVHFVNDTLGELRVTSDLRTAGSFSRNRYDTVRIAFHPAGIGIRTDTIRITLKQADGYPEDTIITQTFQGLPSRGKLQYSVLTGQQSIDFGSETLCSGDSLREITITNTGCASADVTTLRPSGGEFTLLSSFRRITLDPGNARTYLLKFKPASLGSQSGSLFVESSLGVDTIALTGIGLPGRTGAKLVQSTILTFLCDSVDASCRLHNTSCSAMIVDSVLIDGPISLLGFTSSLLQSDSSLVLNLRFVPIVGGSEQDSVHVFTHVDGLEFDTALTLSTTAIDGGPDITLSANSIDFGNVSTCQRATRDLVISSSGCDTLLITSTTLGTGGFALQSAIPAALPRGTNVNVHIAFTPITPGPTSVLLTLHTNLGDKLITLLATGTSDPGSVLLSAKDTTTFVCESGVFTIAVENTTCDSLMLDSATIGGIDAADFALGAIATAILPPTSTDTISGIFQPQAGGSRSASITVHFHRTDGTTFDTTIAILGDGIAPSPVHLTIPDTLITEHVATTVRLPVYSTDSTVLPVSHLDMRFRLNTDLLSPIALDIQNTELAGATVSTFDVSAKPVLHIAVDIPAGVRISKGIIGWITFATFVTDTLSTEVHMDEATFSNSSIPLSCLSTTALDSIARFRLIPNCGDVTVSESMGGRIGISIAIANITPNPAHDRVFVSLAVSSGYTNDAVIEVFDAIGNLTTRVSVIVPPSHSLETIELPLSGASGVRFIRLSSRSGIVTRRVVLAR